MKLTILSLFAVALITGCAAETSPAAQCATDDDDDTTTEPCSDENVQVKAVEAQVTPIGGGSRPRARALR